jgi:hypothetical protein
VGLLQRKAFLRESSAAALVELLGCLKTDEMQQVSSWDAGLFVCCAGCRTAVGGASSGCAGGAGGGLKWCSRLGKQAQGWVQYALSIAWLKRLLACRCECSSWLCCNVVMPSGTWPGLGSGCASC